MLPHKMFPHITLERLHHKCLLKYWKTAISIIQSHSGVDWNGERAHLIVGIAAKDDEHIDVLSKLADLIEDPEEAKKIWEIDSVDKIYDLFS